MRFYWFFLFFILISCSNNNENLEKVKEHETKKVEPEYSEVLKNKAMELVEAAGSINSGVENGINNKDFSDAIGKYNTTLSILTDILPDDFSPVVIKDLNYAKDSWSYTLKMWTGFIQFQKSIGSEIGYDSVDHNSFSYFNAPPLWKDALILVKEGEDYSKKYHGFAKYSSIQSTMGVGGYYFERAKPYLLDIIK